jgi:hypothetical protein
MWFGQKKKVFPSIFYRKSLSLWPNHILTQLLTNHTLTQLLTNHTLTQLLTNHILTQLLTNHILTQLLKNHSCFRSYLYKMKKAPTPLCSCPEKVEQKAHLMTECSLFSKDRPVVL